MDLLYVFDHRFFGTPDGSIWTTTMYEESFWTRYLSVFQNVEVVARVKFADVAKPEWRRVDGAHIKVVPVPYYQGPKQFLRVVHGVLRSLRCIVPRKAALIFRCPSHLSMCTAPYLYRSFRPFGIEVVGDPDSVFSAGVSRHMLRPVFRQWFTRGLRWQCSNACAVSYVSRQLEQLYPASQGVFSTRYSDAQLHDDAFGPDRSTPSGSVLRLVTVASLDQHYKGIDHLLDAVSICRTKGLNVTLTVVGEGRLRPEFERHAERVGVAAVVTFAGAVPSGQGVRNYLDAADLFVLPSLTEGLSRALLEAMARGLPCIGSAVGGLPEVLRAEELVPPASPISLAAKISEIAGGQERWKYLSVRNRLVARRYREARSSRRRNGFCQRVKDITAEWNERMQDN